MDKSSVDGTPHVIIINNNLISLIVETNCANLLVIIIDTNPSQRIVRQNPQHMTQCLESVIAFGNAHLMQNAQNKLAVLSCHHHST